MAISFNLKDLQATVTNVKTKPDTDADGEKDVRAHIDVKAEVDAALMNQFSLGDEFDFGSVFFTGKGDVVNVGIKKMEIDRKYEDHYLTIQHDHLNGKEEVKLVADIHQISITPIQGNRFVLRFRAASNPGMNNIAFITESQITDCIISIEPMQTDLTDQGE